MNVGNIVIISNKNESLHYVIKGIGNDDEVVISPITNQDIYNKLVKTPNGWRVKNANGFYRVIFQDMIFTYVPDIDINIINNLSHKELLNICSVNKYVSMICQLDILWINRLTKIFGEESLIYKPNNKTWEKYYLDLMDLWDDIYFGIHVAIDSGYIFFLQKAKDNGVGLEGFETYAEEAAAANKPEVLKWMIEQDVSGTAIVLDLAVQYRFYDLLNWLETQNILPDSDALDKAAENGDLELLKHYANIGLLPNRYGAYIALENEHNNVVDWLETHGIYPD